MPTLTRKSCSTTSIFFTLFLSSSRFGASNALHQLSTFQLFSYWEDFPRHWEMIQVDAMSRIGFSEVSLNLNEFQRPWDTYIQSCWCGFCPPKTSKLGKTFRFGGYCSWYSGHLDFQSYINFEVEGMFGCNYEVFRRRSSNAFCSLTTAACHGEHTWQISTSLLFQMSTLLHGSQALTTLYATMAFQWLRRHGMLATSIYTGVGMGLFLFSAQFYAPTNTLPPLTTVGAPGRQTTL